MFGLFPGFPVLNGDRDRDASSLNDELGVPGSVRLGELQFIFGEAELGKLFMFDISRRFAKDVGSFLQGFKSVRFLLSISFFTFPPSRE